MYQIPHVLRARNFRLYLARGTSPQETNNCRLVDLWLNGGAAVLGHTPPSLLRELKNTASRGLYAPLPHFTENRFLKALSKLLPGRSFRLYAAPPQNLVSFSENMNLHGLARVKEEDERKICSDIKLWRPYTDPLNPFAVDDTPLLIPVLPGIHTWRGGLPMGLCVVAALTGNAASEELLSRLPPDDALSPIILAIATRGIYDILAAPERANPELPRVSKALKHSRWQRCGIYLNLQEKQKTEEWDTLFHQFLKAGFLLPPTPSSPVILPGELSKGEEIKLALMLKFDFR